MRKISGLFLFSLLAITPISCQPSLNDITEEINKIGQSPVPTAVEGASGSSPVPSTSVQVNVTTIAGSKSGFADGIGTNAMFSSPRGLAVDNSGNVFVGDSDNLRIRKITPGGSVSTLAGNGQFCLSDCFKNGTGTEASFQSVDKIAIDKSTGILYVSDRSNYRIRKITPGGVVSTIAGSGKLGTADGSATTATFSSLGGITVDNTGNIFVIDGSKIRMVTQGGTVTTIAGGAGGFVDETGTKARFRSPGALVADKSGNLYIADSGNGLIRKMTPGGVVTTIAGTGTLSTFLDVPTVVDKNHSFFPAGITLDSSNNIYITDISLYRIRKINKAGFVSDIAGQAGGSTFGKVDGPGTVAKFHEMSGIDIDLNGNLYVADTSNQTIRKITFL